MREVAKRVVERYANTRREDWRIASPTPAVEAWALARAYLEALEALGESANALTNLIAWCDGPMVAHEDARRNGTAALQLARAFLAEQEEGKA